MEGSCALQAECVTFFDNQKYPIIMSFKVSSGGASNRVAHAKNIQLSCHSKYQAEVHLIGWHMWCYSRWFGGDEIFSSFYQDSH
jgi:hypothetical protein